VKSDALPEVLLLNPQLPSNFDMIYDAQTDAAGRAGVIVRLGLTQHNNFNGDDFLREILSAFP